MAKKDKSSKKPESAVPVGEKEEKAVEHWRKLLDASLERERNYRKLAREVIDIYEECDEGEIPFNILYANTETLAPALFSNIPRPETRTRSRVPNATADAAAGLVDSYLENFVDSGDARYEPFSAVVSTAVLQALVPGRGIGRVHYAADVKRSEAGDPMALIDESVFVESVDWNKIRFGFAKKWEDVPWIAFEHNFTYDEAEAKWGATKAEKLKYGTPEDDPDMPKSPDEQGVEVSTCFEIWCKKTRKVYWIESCGEVYLETLDDPFRLEGFFPIPKPLMFFFKIKDMVPVPLYKVYKQQAAELNRITRRITGLIEAMKIRGFYDNNQAEMAKIFEQEENTLLALTNLAAMGQGAKAENAIWLAPIDKHAVVLQTLLAQRQAILQVIYQIMGIADIMRGSSVASETLGAQEIKSKWGTLRLKKAQKAVADFARDLMRLGAELAFSRMQPENLRMLTGSKLLGQAQADQMEQAAAMAQQTGQQIPPEVQEQLALPTFEECVELLRRDVLRRYTIDIETNSTLEPETTEDKENMADFLNAFSQFLNGLFPMVEAGILSAEVIKGVMLALSRRFRMGKDLDPYIQKIGAAGPNVGEQKKQLEEQAKALAEGEKKVKAEADKVQREKIGLEKSKAQFQIAQIQAQVKQVTAALSQDVKNAKAKAELEKLIIQLEKAMMQASQPQGEAKEPEHADV